MTHRMGQDRGLTLLELVAATAIFAMVAMMALQALTGGLIQRRVIEAADSHQAALMRALSLLRQDLQAAVPAPHLPATGAAGPALELLPAGGFALSRAGLPGLSGPDDPGLARVVWRIEAGQVRLIRRVLPLTGSEASVRPEQVVLEGVSAVTLIPRGEWADAPAGLPPGLEVVLETRDWGQLRLVVAR